MLFAAPLFLLGLIPWLGVVLWVLLGKRQRVDVPFLELWRGPVSGPTPKPHIGMPPIALAAVLAAMLLGILAAARPGIRGTGGNPGQKPIVVVVDRGITMSMGAAPRFQVVADEQVKGPVKDEFRGGPVHVVFVPGGDVIKRTVDDWVNAVKSVERTAVDTRGAVEAAAAEQMRQNPASPIIVLSDQAIADVDGRVVRVSPQGEIRNISIAHVAARISPTPQLLVRLRNQSDGESVTIQVREDDRIGARMEVELPRRGEVRDYFLPIDKNTRLLRIEASQRGDFTGDNFAYLVRRQSWPAIEPRTPVFAELRRLIEEYSKLRPAGEQSKRVAMVRAADSAAVGEPAVIFGEPRPGPEGRVDVVDHPITRALSRDVDWSGMSRSGVADGPTDGGWQPLVRVGERTLLAARLAPARQVWVGFDTQRMASLSEFVILWSNIFDWVGEGGEEFVAQRTGQLGREWKPTDYLAAELKPGWWPGIYQRADGALLAVNAPDVVSTVNPTPTWRARLAEMAKEQRSGSGIRSLATWLLVGAVALMLLAAMTWRGTVRRGHLSAVAHAAQVAHAPSARG